MVHMFVLACVMVVSAAFSFTLPSEHGGRLLQALLLSNVCRHKTGIGGCREKKMRSQCGGRILPSLCQERLNPAAIRLAEQIGSST
jgi:hypothetical protein